MTLGNRRFDKNTIYIGFYILFVALGALRANELNYKIKNVTKTWHVNVINCGVRGEFSDRSAYLVWCVTGMLLKVPGKRWGKMKSSLVSFQMKLGI